MIRAYHKGRSIEYEELRTAVGLAEFSSPILSVVGGGGKTTVILRVAAEYTQKKLPVIVTTTTHMRLSKQEQLLTAPDMEQLAGLVKKRQAVWLGVPGADGKLSPLPLSFLEAARLLHLPMLIEADGSKGRPCKAPAAHEPVVWGKSTAVIGMVGLDAVNRPIGEVCHRPECVQRLLNKGPEELLTCADIVTIGLSNQGMKKSLDPYMKYSVILNKADDAERIQLGEEIVERFQSMGQTQVLLTSGLLTKSSSPDTAAYAVVVLAAGQSLRFGSNKLVAQIAQKPMYRYALDTLEGLADVAEYIVTGSEEIRSEAQKQGMQTVWNGNPERGISHSMQLGIRAAYSDNPDCRGIVFMVCDQPGLTRAALEKLLTAAKEHPGKIICAAENGENRNPTVWDRKYMEELCTLTGDAGGRQLLQKYNNHIIQVEIAGKELRDIDQKRDLDTPDVG